MRNQKEYLNDLLTQYGEGTISSNDFEYLLDALNNTSDEEMFEVLSEHWNSFSYDENDIHCDKKKVQLYKSLRHELRKHKEERTHLRVPMKRRWLYIAAAFVLLIVGTWIVRGYIDNLKADRWERQNVVVQSGGVGNSLILLPDGSKITLNAKSQLSYRSDFGRNRRQVMLRGQGFFEVAHDAKKAFVVETDCMDITVYGTVFNVYAYENNEIVEMSLLDGNVKVETKGPLHQSFDVKPNEKVTFNKVTGKLLLEPTDNMLETAWMRDTLIFREDKLRDVFSNLERRFGITINVDTEDLLDDTYTGTFNDERFESIMKVLQLHYHFRYELKDNEAYVFFDGK